MSIQSNFPNLQPSLLLDFANTKQLDNRVTFTRSTPATYYDGKTTAKAEQNLLYPSVNIGSPYQNSSNVLTNNTGTAPDGTTTASLLVPNTSNIRHYCSSPLASTGILNTPYTISLFAKPSGYNFIFVQFSGSVSSGGSRYGVTFNISTGAIETSGFSYSVNVASTSSTITSVGSGWYRITMTASMTSAVTNLMCYVQSMPLNGSTYPSGGDGLPSYAGDGTNGAFFWGFQLEQRNAVTAYNVTTTQTITKYIPALLTAGGNQPRFDHNPTTGESLGLLIEGARTNLVFPSDLYGDSLNHENIYTVTDSSTDVIAPNGSQLTTKIVSGTTGNTWYWLEPPGGTIAASSTYTISVWLRCATGTTATWILNPYPFNFSTTCNVTDQWQRFSVTFTSDGSGTQPYIGLVSPTLSRTFYAWGWQVEAGSHKTSYIKTTSASATRTADVAQISGTNLTSWYSQGNGTFYAEASTASVAGDVMILEGTNSTNAFLDVSMTFATTSTQFINRFTSLNSDIRKSGAVSANTMVKFSGSITSSLETTVGATNGTTAPAVGGFTANFGADRMFIGSRGGSSLFLNAPIRKLAFYPAQLTQTQQNSITG